MRRFREPITDRTRERPSRHALKLSLLLGMVASSPRGFLRPKRETVANDAPGRAFRRSASRGKGLRGVRARKEDVEQREGVRAHSQKLLRARRSGHFRANSRRMPLR